MYRTTARVLAVVIGTLGLVGLFIEDDHLLEIMNVDIAMDVLRLVIAAVLAIVGFGRATARTRRTVLGLVGGLYVVLGLIAIADRELLGLAPNEFTEFDIAFHLVVGFVTIAIASKNPRTELTDDDFDHTNDNTVRTTAR